MHKVLSYVYSYANKICRRRDIVPPKESARKKNSRRAELIFDEKLTRQINFLSIATVGRLNTDFWISSTHVKAPNMSFTFKSSNMRILCPRTDSPLHHFLTSPSIIPRFTDAALSRHGYNFRR